MTANSVRLSGSTIAARGDYFDTSLRFVLDREGGFVNHPNDPGGATNYGITQRTYNHWLKAKGLPPKPVENISTPEVRAIYFEDYWLKSGCDQMPWALCAVHFDTAVNMGSGRAKGFARSSGLSAVLYLTARTLRYIERITVEHPKSAVFARGWANRVKHLADFVGVEWGAEGPSARALREAHAGLRALYRRRV